MGSKWLKPDVERFAEKLAEDGDCWRWIGALSSGTGYGSFWDGQRKVGAHRWSYEHHVGEIPEGLQLDHLCRNRWCVNPYHLDPVTNAVNTSRGRLGQSIRDRAAALTHCPHGHPKTEANVYRNYNPKRSRWESTCRPCRNARLRSRHKAALFGGGE